MLLVILSVFVFVLAEAMVMGKLHKEIGHLIVQSAEDTDRTDVHVIKVNWLEDGTGGTAISFYINIVFLSFIRISL